MSNHGTLSEELPGWYIQFQADVLLQLPRPDEIEKERALAFHEDRYVLRERLHDAICLSWAFHV